MQSKIKLVLIDLILQDLRDISARSNLYVTLADSFLS